MAKKRVEPLKLESYSYDEYRVVELLLKKGDRTAPQEYIEEAGRAWRADILAPDGISMLDIKGATIVEVKRNLSYSDVKEISSLFEALRDKYNVVVVYYRSSIANLPAENKEHGNTFLYISFKELKDRTKLRTETDKETFYANKGKQNDWKAAREIVIKNAQEASTKGNNALFLGAGVGMSADMPSWTNLLKGLMGEVKQLKPETLDAFKELNTHVFEECGDSYLIMARYLQTAIRQYDKKAEFSEKIQAHLYGDKDESPLLDVLTKIVQQKKVREVLTYNFDDLLEQNLERINLKNGIDFVVISKDADIKEPDIVPIYHVHGIIPKQGPVDKVVFSEEEYHERYSSAFHWSNIEQLHAMTRMHGFFVGLSMTDPNVRRLLDVARKMNMTSDENHYAFLRRTKLEKYCVSDIEKSCKYVHVSESLIDKKKQKEIYDLNYTVIESIFLELGVQVIWFEGFDELPSLVARVFGLTKYQSRGIDELIQLCESKIQEIKGIEAGMPKANAANLSLSDVAAFIQYKADYGIEYRNAIDDAKDILNDLTERIKEKDFTYNDACRLQNNVPKYDNNISGFGDFFATWLEAVKLLLGKN